MGAWNNNIVCMLRKACTGDGVCIIECVGRDMDATIYAVIRFSDGKYHGFIGHVGNMVF